MHLQRISILIILLTTLSLSGCAHVISEQSRSLVDPTITYAMLKEKPDAFVGKYVQLGGVIVGVKNTTTGSQLEIMQVALDKTGMPEDTFRSEGRFLAISESFLDSMIYKPDRLVTLVGEVKGKKVMPVDEVEYTYPVLAIKEIYVWKSYDYEKGYPYPTPPPYSFYDPYYYGYWPGPYWYRPLGPVYRRW
ncbi:Slp family lipoprotein [Geobacter grbiciae]|uniref:Slp family lipoprotein n=1 Tax=Geobacter grbiciae TaxID=155042 RepID=UPI001C02AEBF|nr:Slp family lipoprotein [Geobacter grbiciae]MBT1076723.1 Slp family lipoprotein [Geobacter grbiciae]